MATRKAVSFHGNFIGLYEWGEGWLSHDVKEKWNFWWKYEFPKIVSYEWHTYIPGSSSSGCGRLVGMDGYVVEAGGAAVVRSADGHAVGGQQVLYAECLLAGAHVVVLATGRDVDGAEQRVVQQDGGRSGSVG
jgi:hypothetical protein